MEAAAAAVLHEGMCVPMSSQSIQSKYFCYLMENVYTKVNVVCMYECMHAADMYTSLYSFFFLFLFNKV